MSVSPCSSSIAIVSEWVVRIFECGVELSERQKALKEKGIDSMVEEARESNSENDARNLRRTCEFGNLVVEFLITRLGHEEFVPGLLGIAKAFSKGLDYRPDNTRVTHRSNDSTQYMP